MLPQLEFFYDIGSSYSYLGFYRVRAFAAGRVDVVFRPFLLGAVFKTVGNQMPAALPARAAWMQRDLALSASLLDLPMTLPASFPANTLTVQRLLTAASGQDDATLIAATDALFQAYWGRGEDIGDVAVIRDALEAAGIDAEPLLAATQDPAVKNALRAVTDEAVARGAFGAPTIYVGDAMFFGSDRFDLIDAHLKELGK